MMRALRTNPALAAPLLALAVLGVLAALWRGSWLVPLELALRDRLLRSAPPTAGAPNVVLVRIGEEDIGRFGHPLDDATLARALEALLASGPRAVGVDLYRDRPVGAGGAALAQRAQAERRLVWIEKLADDRSPGVPPPAFVSDPGRIGFSDMAPDADGVVRSALLFLWDEEDRPHLSLALQLALRHLEPEGLGLQADPDDPRAIRLGETSVLPLETDDGGYVGADAGGFGLLLDYRRSARPPFAYTLGEVLGGRFDPDSIRDRSVILGTAAPSVKDEFSTPMGVGIGADSRVTGIELHAGIFEQLIGLARGERKPVRFAPEWAEALALALACALGAALGVASHGAGALVAGAAACALLPLAASALLLRADLWVPGAGPSLGVLASAAAGAAWSLQRTRAERAAVMQLFGRFVSRAVADRIWAQRDEFMEDGRPRPQRLTATVLLADLEGYTAVAEKLEPEALVAWVSEFMALAARAIERHGGVVDDYAGDGIKANFGVPVARLREEEIAADAGAAVRCALCMGQEFTALDRRWRGAGLPGSRLRIGIATGPVVVGNIGSAERLKYTTLGDTVNVAARLESFDKDGGHEGSFRILVSTATRRRLPGEIASLDLGLHRVRNRRDPIGIHRVLGPPAPALARAGESP